MSATTTAPDDADLTELLLRSDAASLAIENSGDSQTLKCLAEFGKKLTKYANMMIQQDRIKRERDGTAVSTAAQPRQTTAEPHPALDPAPSAAASVAVPVTPPQEVNRVRATAVAADDRQGEESLAAVPDEVVSDPPAGTRGETYNHQGARGRSNRRIFGPPARLGRSSTGRANDEDDPAMTDHEGPEEASSEAFAAENEDDAPVPPGLVATAVATTNETVASASDDDAILRTPRPPDYDGTLEQTQLFASAGRTRMVLNEHIPQLGLTSPFGQGVVSGRGGTISHITLSHLWNDLPYHPGERLQWYVGEGPNRAKIASPLDPNLQPQDDGGIPVFWAMKNSGGGDLCHYVGHWKCVRFDRLAQPSNEDDKMIIKKRGRSALLEFEFVTFDDEMDWTIFKMEGPTKKRKVKKETHE